MASTAVIDRTESTEIVVSAQEAHGADIGAQATALLAPFTRGAEVVPDLGLAGALVARMMEGATAELEVADKAHEDELDDDPPKRAKRDDAQFALNATMVSLRRQILGGFGEVGLKAVKLDGETPDDPVVLADRAQKASKELKAGKLPAPLYEEVLFNAPAWAIRLKTEAKRVKDTRSEVQTEHRKAEGTMFKRLTALETNDARFRQGANFIVGLFSLVAEYELASRVRPSPARPGRVKTPPES